MENKEKLHAEAVENQVDEKIRERHEWEAKAVNQVEFDTSGLTEKCPRLGFTYYDRCQKCQSYLGHYGFTVYCGYHDIFLGGTLGSKMEMAVNDIVAGDYDRVDFETDVFYATVYVVDKIIRIDLKEKK